jgi:hypothetical protein
MAKSKARKVGRQIQLTIERLAFVVMAIGFAKVCQYSVVGVYGNRFGFALASAVGLIPSIGLILLIEYRFLRRRYEPKPRISCVDL